jgi:hypothetical protein
MSDEQQVTRPGLLVTALQAAVPMWLAEADKRHGETRAELLAAWRREAVDVVASSGDNILYLGHKRGDTAKAFNSLARGLAVLSLMRGGVTVFGLIWCAKHLPGGAYADGPSCPACCTQELRSRLVAAMWRLRERLPVPEEDVSDRIIGEA